MLSRIAFVAALVGSTVAAVCPADTRLKGAECIIRAYNDNTPGQTAEIFESCPFGSPDKAGTCLTTIIADGACPVPVATTGYGVAQFGIESRQAFSSVTGEYVSFPNGTTLINTNVTLGVRSDVVIPVTFTGHVYLDYTDDCRMYAVRAYAQVPTYVLNQTFQEMGVPSLPSAVCDLEP